MTVSEKAAREIVRQDSGRGRWLSIAVVGGGCSGFQYRLVWMDPLPIFTNDCHLLEGGGATVFIDPKSWIFLQDTSLDFDPFKGFIFDNPRAKGTCGCGESVQF